MIGCLSLGTLSAQEFHLQPTPQVYETFQDSIVPPVAYSLSADAGGDAADAVRLLGSLLPEPQAKASFRITVATSRILSTRCLTIVSRRRGCITGVSAPSAA